MHFFRAYGVPMLVVLPIAVILGLLGSFLIPLVNIQAVRLLLFLLLCLGSLVVAAFVLHYMPDHTLDYEDVKETEEKASDSSEGKTE